MNGVLALHISMMGAAFAEGNPQGEIARILRNAAERIEGEALDGSTLVLRDVNGNRVGEVLFSGMD